VVLGLLLLTIVRADLPAQAPAMVGAPASGIGLATLDCPGWSPRTVRRNPSTRELRCRYAIHGPGRFGLAEHLDVPVYQPATPLPGTHIVGLSSVPRPREGESYEEWEWRVHRTRFGPEVRQVHRGLELLDPLFAVRIADFESQLSRAGIRFQRRETWRSPERQAFLFQQGRSRPGAIVTATLTSLHSFVDENGAPRGRAVDYDVPRAHLERFHEYVAAFDFKSYGADSFDPGHVYLLTTHDVGGDELALLRTLPRVPVVTISTGRPMDEEVSPEAHRAYRQKSFEWVQQPFADHPPPVVALSWHRVPVVGAREPPASRPVELEPEPAPSVHSGGLIQSLVHWIRGRRETS
jgi:hypothetical protein